MDNNMRDIKPCKIVDFKINYNDNCFTAIMRAIGRPDLIDKYRGSLHVFMNAYRKKVKEMASELNLLDSDNDDTFGNLNNYDKPIQRGHIIVLNNKVVDGSSFRGTYTLQYGVITEDFDVSVNGHMMLCLDPEKNLYLHMHRYGTDWLILTVQEIDLDEYTKTKKTILDGEVIDKL